MWIASSVIALHVRTWEKKLQMNFTSSTNFTNKKWLTWIEVQKTQSNSEYVRKTAGYFPENSPIENARRVFN